jgi:hypothetical protein
LIKARYQNVTSIKEEALGYQLDRLRQEPQVVLSLNGYIGYLTESAQLKGRVTC